MVNKQLKMIFYADLSDNQYVDRYKVECEKIYNEVKTKSNSKMNYIASYYNPKTKEFVLVIPSKSDTNYIDGLYPMNIKIKVHKDINNLPPASSVGEMIIVPTPKDGSPNNKSVLVSDGTEWMSLIDGNIIDQMFKNNLKHYYDKQEITKLLDDYCTKEILNNTFANCASLEQLNALKESLKNYITKEEYLNKIASVMRYKGSVDLVKNLPTNAEIGDVYNVDSTGANYAYNGNKWDKLSETLDLSSYITKSEIETIKQEIVSSIGSNPNIDLSEYVTKADLNDYYSIDRVLLEWKQVADSIKSKEGLNTLSPQAKLGDIYEFNESFYVKTASGFRWLGGKLESGSVGLDKLSSEVKELVDKKVYFEDTITNTINSEPPMRGVSVYGISQAVRYIDSDSIKDVKIEDGTLYNNMPYAPFRIYNKGNEYGLKEDFALNNFYPFDDDPKMFRDYFTEDHSHEEHLTLNPLATKGMVYTLFLYLQTLINNGAIKTKSLNVDRRLFTIINNITIDNFEKLGYERISNSVVNPNVLLFKEGVNNGVIYNDDENYIEVTEKVILNLHNTTTNKTSSLEFLKTNIKDTLFSQYNSIEKEF